MTIINKDFYTEIIELANAIKEKNEHTNKE